MPPDSSCVQRQNGLNEVLFLLIFIYKLLTFYKIFQIQMNKSLFVLLCLIGLTLSIKINHLDETPNVQTTPTPPQPVPEPQPSPEQIKAYTDFMNFIQRDNSLRKAFSEGRQPTPIQLQKITGFMVNHQFFRQKMLKELIQSPGNQWIGSLSQEAQIRFLKIITSVPPNKLNNEKIAKSLGVRLLNDKEIGPEILKRYGQGVKPEDIKNFITAVDKGAVAAHHRAISLSA